MWINPINKDHELAQKWIQCICFNMIIQSWRCEQKKGVLWLKSLGLYQQKHKNHIPNSGTCNQETHHITYKYHRAIEQTTRQFRRIQTSSCSLKTCHKSKSPSHWHWWFFQMGMGRNMSKPMGLPYLGEPCHVISMIWTCSMVLVSTIIPLQKPW